jgi:hypothetical protein
MSKDFEKWETIETRRLCVCSTPLELSYDHWICPLCDSAFCIQKKTLFEKSHDPL